MKKKKLIAAVICLVLVITAALPGTLAVSADAASSDGTISVATPETAQTPADSVVTDDAAPQSESETPAEPKTCTCDPAPAEGEAIRKAALCTPLPSSPQRSPRLSPRPRPRPAPVTPPLPTARRTRKAAPSMPLLKSPQFPLISIPAPTTAPMQTANAPATCSTRSWPALRRRLWKTSSQKRRKSILAYFPMNRFRRSRRTSNLLKPFLYLL